MDLINQTINLIIEVYQKLVKEKEGFKLAIMNQPFEWKVEWINHEIYPIPPQIQGEKKGGRMWRECDTFGVMIYWSPI